MPDLTHDLIQQQIAGLEPKTKIVIVHPSYLPQHFAIQCFWTMEQCCYLRLERTDLSREQLDVRLAKALSEQVPNCSPDTLKLLILDECDNTTDELLESFLTELFQIVGGRIVVLSRHLPMYLRSNPKLRNCTQVIPSESGLLLPEYVQKSDKNALLEVRTLGSGRVLLNGRVVDSWDGELPRNLFFFLVDRGMTTRAQIFDTFWPNLSTREATNVFHVTKRKISEVLGLDLTYYSSGFYRISPEIELDYDVAIFNELLQQAAVESPENAKQRLERAVWLYRGEFLGQINAGTNTWVQRRRHELSQSYGDTLIALAKYAEQADNAYQALGLYIRALATNRQREDLAGIIMGLYKDFGMHQDALQTYDVLANEIMNTLGISPAQWLQDLAANIRSLELPASQPVRS